MIIEQRQEKETFDLIGIILSEEIIGPKFIGLKSSAK